jgi:transposase
MTRKREQITTEQVQELANAYDQCSDGATRIRYQAVRLYAQGYRAAEILSITRCSYRSLLNWWRSYRKQGVDGLVDQRNGGNHTLLSAEQIADLRELLHTYTPAQLLGSESAMADGEFWSVPDLVTVVAQRYQVSYSSLTSYRNLFKQCGFSYQRSQKSYRSRTEVKVADFEEQLEKNSST